VSQLWWLSFCDPGRPVGQKFLGACIVPASGMVGAIRVAHEQGCNPGGEVVGHPIPGQLAPRVPANRIGVLMTREQAEAFDKETQS
jgi:hypothetical protein